MGQDIGSSSATTIKTLLFQPKHALEVDRLIPIKQVIECTSPDHIATMLLSLLNMFLTVFISLQNQFSRHWVMYLKLYGEYERVSSISDSFSTCICWDLAVHLHSTAYHAF